MKIFVSVLCAVILGTGGYWLSNTFSGRSNGSEPVMAKQSLVEHLTVEETLGAVFIRGNEGQPQWNIFKAGNPQAKAAIYKTLESKDEKVARYHANALWVLGYIGTETDAKRLEKMVQERFSGLLTSTEQGTLEATFTSLAIMSGRGIAPATEILDRMMRIDYWSPARFQFFPERMEKTIPRIIPPEYETLIWVLWSYARSGRDDVQAKANMVLQAVRNNPRVWKIMDGSLRSESLKAAYSEMQDVETQKISPEIRAILPQLFNGDLKNPGPSKGGIGPVEGTSTQVVRRKSPETQNQPVIIKTETAEQLGKQFVERISKEALKQYDQFKAMLLKGDFDGFLAQALDNGRPIDVKKIKRSEEFKSEMQRTQAFVASLSKLKTTPSEFQVERRTETAADGKTKTEVVEISFKLDGTSEIGKKTFPRQLGTNRTVAEDGTLIVFMQRRNGKWYWNPFGW